MITNDSIKVVSVYGELVYSDKTPYIYALAIFSMVI